MTSRCFWLVSLFLSCLFYPPGIAAGVSKYHVAKQVKLKGDSGWDYLTIDSARKRLYVTRATHVAVMDLESLKEVGRIEGTAGVHGVALAPELSRGYTSNGAASTVTIFDLETLKVLGQVPAGKKPDAILYEPVSKRVLAFNGESESVTVIDAGKGLAVGTIALGGKPEFAVTAGGKVFVNIEDKNQVVSLDPLKLTTLAKWPIASCVEPTGLAIDAEHHRLFAACHNERLAVVDSENGKGIASLPIGKGVDAAAFDPETRLIFSSNGEGTISVIREESPDKFSVEDTVPTQKSARTMALDTSTHRIYTLAAQFAPRSNASTGGKKERPAIVPDSVTLLVLER